MPLQPEHGSKQSALARTWRWPPEPIPRARRRAPRRALRSRTRRTPPIARQCRSRTRSRARTRDRAARSAEGMSGRLAMARGPNLVARLRARPMQRSARAFPPGDPRGSGRDRGATRTRARLATQAVGPQAPAERRQGDGGVSAARRHCRHVQGSTARVRAARQVALRLAVAGGAGSGRGNRDAPRARQPDDRGGG